MNKICVHCKEDKDISNFGKSNAKKDGISNICKSCAREAFRNYRNRHPERVKANRRRRGLKAFGITPDDYNNFVKKQNGLCAICQKSGKLFVDHNHKTGKVRGLLCNTCNIALGMSKDNITILKNAIVYLENNQ